MLPFGPQPKVKATEAKPASEGRGPPRLTGHTNPHCDLQGSGGLEGPRIHLPPAPANPSREHHCEQASRLLGQFRPLPPPAAGPAGLLGRLVKTPRSVSWGRALWARVLFQEVTTFRVHVKELVPRFQVRAPYFTPQPYPTAPLLSHNNY